MRKINKDELIKVSSELAVMFADYSAYRLFFDENSLHDGMLAFFACEVYPALDFTYVGGDYDVIASVKKPGDRERPLAELFADAKFAEFFKKAVDGKALNFAKEYVKFNEALAKRHYDASTDCYIKNIGVAEKARGRGLLRKTVDELCDGLRIYLETHSEENVAIYKKLGFTLLEQTDFHGVPVYAMAREAAKTAR